MFATPGDDEWSFMVFCRVSCWRVYPSSPSARNTLYLLNDRAERVLGEVLRRDVGKLAMCTCVVDGDPPIVYQRAEEEAKSDVLVLEL